MKKIIKNLIFVFILTTVFSFGVNFAFASTPTIISTTANPSTTSAVLSGSINPNGITTTAWFETPSGGPFQLQNLGNGNSDVTMLSYTLTGLTANTTYTFRVKASNSDGVIDSGWISFTTNSNFIPTGSTPTITSVNATNITQNSATFNAIVNPHGNTTNMWFETPSGGPFQLQNLGNGNSDVTMLSYTLTGLTANTTYTFRVKGANNNGVGKSNWISFTTSGGSNNCTTPTISSISPNNANEGSGTITIAVYGSGFINGTSSAKFKGSSKTTNVSNSGYLTMTLTSSDVSSSGSENITVSNGSGCESNPVIFTINHVGGGSSGGGGSSSYYPYITTSSVSSISTTSATFNGTVSPRNHSTTAWFEYGTSSNLGTYSETTHLAQGSSSSTISFSQSAFYLTPNTTYYFRAVANNTYGTKKGSILSFTTGNAPVIPVTTGAVTTVQATNKTYSSAKLNGIFVNQDGTSTQGYFEYGATASMGSTTVKNNLGTNSSIVFSNYVTNLIPDTIYYFRAIVVKGETTYTGKILVFQTPKINVIGQNIENNTPVNTEPTITADQSSMLKISTEEKKVSAGDELNYLVTFKNKTSENFENTKITVQLPKEVDFKESNFGKKGNDNTVIFDVGILVPGQVGSMTIKGKVNSKASAENIIITTAVMAYYTPNSSNEKNEISYVSNNVISGTGLEANSIFGINFLPVTLLGWLLLIIAMLIVVIIGNSLYSNYAVKNSTRRENSDHIDNLPT